MIDDRLPADFDSDDDLTRFEYVLKRGFLAVPHVLYPLFIALLAVLVLVQTYFHFHPVAY